MKKIRLLNTGKFMLVDDEDYPVMSRHVWRFNSNTGRPSAWINGKTILPNRMLILVERYQEVDHINRNPLDNRKENLRICTRTQNEANKPPGKNNKSGFKGVCWDKTGKKWRAKIKENKKVINLGSFTLKEDAARAYNVAAKKIHQDFAWLNPV